MDAISKWVAALALLLGSMAANAQTVTYAFTGVVTSSAFANFTVGEYVTGTYTFNYDSADQVIGHVPGPTIGPWAIGSTGVPYNPVLASVVKIGGFTYSSSTTAPPSDPDDSSIVTGNGTSTLSAAEATPAFNLASFFTIVETDVTRLGPYTSAGLPVTLSASQSGYGGFIYGSSGLRYQITSLTVAPAPRPATLLATLLTEVIGVGPGKKLEEDVELAQTEYAAGDVAGTCNALAAFLTIVQGKGRKKIAPPLDVTLTRGAQAIAATIGCMRVPAHDGHDSELKADSIPE
jgi:hypothetical protein